MLLRDPLRRLSYRHYSLYWHGLEQYTERTGLLQKCEKGLEANVYPSTEMSVKSFLDKYFKAEPQSSAKIAPEAVLEPMVGTLTRQQLDYYRPTTPLPSRIFHLFTDGACSDNGKKTAKGGFGVHVYANPTLDVSRRLLPNEQQTNNRAELRGIQAALDLIDQHNATWSQTYSEYYIWTDSEYSINCLTKWAKGWKAHNWKKSDGSPLQNLDLIRSLYDRLCLMPRVTLKHVRGHQTSNEFPFDGNRRADALATQSLRT